MKTRVTTIFVLAIVSLSAHAYDHFYNGPAVTTTLNETYLMMEDGQQVPFTEIFAGYTPRSGFGLNLPGGRSNFDIGLVSNRDYQRLFRAYDANENDYLERPEMLVMYIIEAARGMGHPAQYVGTNPQARALDVPTSDTRGLLAFIQGKRGDLSVASNKLFNDMPFIAMEISNAESGGTLDF